MSDDNIHIDQKADHSTNVNMIGILNQYGSDAPRIRDYLTDVVRQFGPLRDCYIDLEGKAPPVRRTSGNPFDNPLLITPVMRLEGRQEPVASVQDALEQHPRLVMLGDPGAGKTTSLKVLLANAAERCLADAESHLLPLLLELGAWPDSVPDLSAYVERHLKASLPLGSKLLLLLDGLNEIGGERREQKIDSIRAYLDGFKLAHVIITCREKDYPKELDEKFGLPKLTVAPLDDARVHRLICAYLPDETQAETLWKAIQPEEYREERALLELARNPYLLTIIAWIYSQNGSMPESSAQLFGQMIELRYQHEARRGKPSFTFEQFTYVLGDLAFKMIDRRRGTSAEKVWMRHQIGEQTDDLTRFGEACSVLVDGSDKVSFFHQLMQEYFAARALDWRGDTAALARSVWLWRETLLTRLGMSKAARDQVIEVFVAALNDKEAPVREAAAGMLGEIKDTRTVAPLIAVLSDEWWEVRRAAAGALGKIKDMRAVAPLIAALSDEWWRVREAAAEALVGFGSAAVAPLIVALSDEWWEVRRAAARVLVGFGSAAVEPLIAALKDEWWEVRRATVEALGKIEDPRAVEPLVAALKDEWWRVREAAAEALGRIEDPRAVEPLVAALKDEWWEVRRAAVDALGKIKDTRAVEPLIAALKDVWRGVCEAAVEAVIGFGSAAVEPLITALRDQRKYVREAAVEALVGIGSVTLDQLIAALKDEDWNVRQAAAEALGEIQDVRAVKPLITALEDEKWYVRQATAEALGKTQDMCAIEPLITALADEDMDVRFAAVGALGKIKDARAIEPLITALADEDMDVRCVAALTLGEIKDACAVKPLIATLKDENEEVRDAAADALRKIGTPEALAVLREHGYEV